MKGNRRLGRILAVKSLYPKRLNLSNPRDTYLKIVRDKDYSREALSFADRLIDKIEENLKEVDGIIIDVLENWSWDRICAMDKTILGVAVTELLYIPENPPKVVINEAIEIAKKYSTEKSGKFINGILDKIARKRGFL